MTIPGAAMAYRSGDFYIYATHQPKTERRTIMPNKTMLILFSDGDEAANAEKIALISACLADEADIVLRKPDDGGGFTNKPCEYADDEDEPLPY
jgi:hypothetical protein